jgi:hypothetical protein
MNEAKRERLAMLAEECAEVIQVVGKILRHGYDSYHPDDPSVTNRELLAKELQDIDGVIYGMSLNRDIDNNAFGIGQCAETWKKKLKWTHYQQE